MRLSVLLGPAVPARPAVLAAGDSKSQAQLVYRQIAVAVRPPVLIIGALNSVIAGFGRNRKH